MPSSLILTAKRIINEAKSKAEQIVQDAEKRADEMCSTNAIRAAARQQGVDMLARAKVASNEIRAGAANYVDQLLADAEEALQSSLLDIQNAKSKMSNIKRNDKR